MVCQPIILVYHYVIIFYDIIVIKAGTGTEPKKTGSGTGIENFILTNKVPELTKNF